ncbi:hypothetical protein ACFX13_004204 [Malus domestica]
MGYKSKLKPQVSLSYINDFKLGIYEIQVLIYNQQVNPKVFINILVKRNSIVTVVFLMSMDLHVASVGRMLHDEKENLKTITTVKKNIVLMDSKQKGDPPPGGPHGKIPRSADLADTTINQRNFAGHTTTTPPPPHDAYPNNVVARSLLGVATDR